MITLFHRPSTPASLRVLAKVKQISAHASETATEDQATDHTSQNKLQRTDFELNVTEEPPTSDQLRSILEYVGGLRASQLVDGARDAQDAMRKLKEDGRKFKAPVVSLLISRALEVCLEADVSSRQWIGTTEGLVIMNSFTSVVECSPNLVIGDDESELMKMIAQLPKENDSM